MNKENLKNAMLKAMETGEQSSLAEITCYLTHDTPDTQHKHYGVNNSQPVPSAYPSTNSSSIQSTPSNQTSNVLYLPIHFIHDVLQYCNKKLPPSSASKKSKKTKKQLITTELSSSIQQYIYHLSVLPVTKERNKLVQFFKTYLDLLAKEIVKVKKPCLLVDITDREKYEDPIIFAQNLWIYNGNRLSGYRQHKSTSLIDLIGKICNCDQNKACTIVATLTSTAFENLYNYTNETHSADYHGNNKCSFICIPEQVGNFELYDRKEIVGFADQKTGYICTYQHAGLIINVMASISKDMLAFGTVSPTAYFINHVEIDKNQEATILLFQNYNQARAFEKYLNQCATPPTNIIVTSHISNDIRTLSWSLLQNRKIIFILETTQHGFNELEEYKKMFNNYNVHYTIYPYPLLFRELSNLTALPEEIENEQLSLLEKTLLEKAELVDDWQIPNNLVKKLIEESLSLENFNDWIRQCTTETKIKESVENLKNSLLEQLAFCPQGNSESVFTDYSQIPLTSFFCNGNITILHARKDSGKSIAALELGKCIAFNTGCFNFIKGSKELKVLYIDGETTKDVLNLRLHQLKLPDKNFSIISLKSLPRNDNELWNSFNLADEGHREELEKLIHQEHIDFLILDNITCLVGDRGIVSEKMAQEVMNWATELSSSASILIIHHTNEEKDKISGSDIWRRRCTNEIQLLGKNDLESLADLSGEIRQIAQSCNGAFFGMRFNSSKSCSILKDKIIWTSLPLGDSDWNIHAITDETGKTLKDFSPEHNEEIFPKNTTPMSPDPAEQPELSDYDKIYNTFGFNPFSRPDIDELFRCEKDKSLKIIKELGELIKETGSGNQKRYCLQSRS